MLRRRSSLVRRLLAIQVLAVLVTVLIAAGVSAAGTRSLVEADAAHHMLGLARTLADAPGVAPAVLDGDSATLQPAAAAIWRGAGASFVTVMTPDGTRLTHPDPALIGQRYQGTFVPAARGATVVETFPGTLGPSVRAVVPIVDRRGGPDGPVVGMVAVGLLRVDVVGRVMRELGFLAVGALGALGLGVALAVLAARRVRRDTLGLEPAEITALQVHHEAVLHAIREGLLVLDGAGRVAVVNDEAARLLGLAGEREPPPARPGAGPHHGRTLAELGVDPVLRRRLADTAPVADETVLVGERLLLVNRTLAGEGAARAAVITLRDRTEVEHVMRALDDARSVAGALRFQAHEHANHLQAVSTLIELGAHDDARDLAVRWSRDITDLGADLRARIADPALAALVVDKATDARDRGLELRVAPDAAVPPGADPAASDDLVTVVGNLLDNALDAALERSGPDRGAVELDLRTDAAGSCTIRVRDDGPGLVDPEAAFAAGWSTKNGATAAGVRGLGLALVARVVERRGGTVTVGAGLPHTRSDGGGSGTGFVVTLPAGSGVPPVDGEAVADAPDGHHEPGHAHA